MICAGAVERKTPLDVDDNIQGYVYDLEDYRSIDMSLEFNKERLARAEKSAVKLAKENGFVFDENDNLIDVRFVK